MKLPRRRFLHLAAGAAVLPVVSRGARAQAYPDRPVRIIVANGAGSAPDTVARLVGSWLSERLGQQFVVENRSGGGSNIGTEAAVRAPSDGYTLLLVSTANAINATLFDKLNFVFLRDIAPVAGILSLPYVMVVHPSVPAKTVPEFIAYAKANPGKLNLGSPGIGTGPHVAGELFKVMTGVDMVHVPYRGAPPALTDLLGGRVLVLFVSTAASIEHIRSGKIRPLAVTTATRWEGLPDVPSVAEFVPGYEASSMYGLGAPANTPAEIVNKLNKEINAGLADPKMKARLPTSAARCSRLARRLGKLIADETEKWGKVIRAANINPITRPQPYSINPVSRTLIGRCPLRDQNHPAIRHHPRMAGGSPAGQAVGSAPVRPER